jgi:hypothetical protein
VKDGFSFFHGPKSIRSRFHRPIANKSGRGFGNIAADFSPHIAIAIRMAGTTGLWKKFRRRTADNCCLVLALMIAPKSATLVTSFNASGLVGNIWFFAVFGGIPFGIEPLASIGSREFLLSNEGSWGKSVHFANQIKPCKSLIEN